MKNKKKWYIYGLLALSLALLLGWSAEAIIQLTGGRSLPPLERQNPLLDSFLLPAYLFLAPILTALTALLGRPKPWWARGLRMILLLQIPIFLALLCMGAVGNLLPIARASATAFGALLPPCGVALGAYHLLEQRR